MCAFESLRDFSRSRLGWDDTELARESVPWSQEALMCNRYHSPDKGYIKQFEELQAVSPEAALARFKDIKGEEYKTESGFTSGAVFTSLIDVTCPHD